MMLQHSSIYHADKSVHSKRRFIFTFFPAWLLPTVQNGSDVLWCFVAVQIFILYFLFIRRYKGNKRQWKSEVKGKGKGKSGAWRKTCTQKFMSLQMITTKTTATLKKKYHNEWKSASNLNNVKTRFGSPLYTFHTFYTLNDVILKLASVHLTFVHSSVHAKRSRQTVHRWHESYKRKLIFLSLATCLYIDTLFRLSDSTHAEAHTV